MSAYLEELIDNNMLYCEFGDGCPMFVNQWDYG